MGRELGVARGLQRISALTLMSLHSYRKDSLQVESIWQVGKVFILNPAEGVQHVNNEYEKDSLRSELPLARF